jgi:toxin-antitoxin system PIN domain toxin
MRQRDLFCIGWPTVMTYLRIATHPAVFNRPLTPDEAMTNVETLLRLPHARFLAEEDGFWDLYREMTARVPTRGNLVPDAHLAALLRQHGVRTLYTHDRDFLQFPFLEVRDPLA